MHQRITMNYSVLTALYLLKIFACPLEASFELEKLYPQDEINSYSKRVAVFCAELDKEIAAWRLDEASSHVNNHAAKLIQNGITLAVNLQERSGLVSERTGVALDSTVGSGKPRWNRKILADSAQILKQSIDDLTRYTVCVSELRWKRAQRALVAACSRFEEFGTPEADAYNKALKSFDAAREGFEKITKDAEQANAAAALAVKDAEEKCS